MSRDLVTNTAQARQWLIGMTYLSLIHAPQTLPAQVNVPRVDFQPRTQRVGDTVTVLGENFSANGSDNIVYFGPARASTVLPNAVQPDRGFRVVVPQGATHDKITVTVGGLTGYSRLLFLPRFFGSGNLTFGGPVFVGQSRNAVLLDFNGDSKLDLASVGWPGAGIQYNFSTYRNTSVGSGTGFEQAANFLVSDSAMNLYDICRGDFDGDGRLDIVITNRDAGSAFDSLVVFRNTGTGSGFRLAARVFEGMHIVGLAVADMDLDGKPDIIVPDRNDGRNGFIRIFRNISSGPDNISFDPAPPIATIRSPWNVVVADFSNDALPDIAWPMNISPIFGEVDSIAVMKNNGAGSYGPVPVSIQLHRPFISQVEAGDLDGDSKTDLVFAHDNGFVSFLRNVSSGTGDIGFSFDDSLTFEPSVNLRRPSITDVSGDGKPDVILPAPSGVVFILKNNTTGDDFRFVNVNPAGFAAQAVPVFVVAGDLNNDGKPDLVVAGNSRTDNTEMAYLMNTTPAAPDSPSLQLPANNSANVQLPVRFVWNSSARATAYHLQIALAQDFSFPVVNDSSLIDTSFQTNTIAYNTTYYWRVAGRTANGDGAYSQPRSFSTASTALLSGGILFPANPTADTSYRLVSIPGISRFTVGDILSGAQTTDWRIFRENGAEPPNDLTELSASEQLKIGEGYLMLRKGTFNFSRTVQMPPVATNGTFSVPVEKKWILIGNPFEKVVKWRSVLAANNLGARTLWAYLGSGGTQPDTMLRPFSGYLFDNTNGVDTLRFPYPFPTVTAASLPSVPFSWKMQLVFETEGKLDKENYIGISPSASFGRDALEEHKPPLFLNKGTISFSRPQWDEASSLFASDFRPTLGDGQVWEFDVRNERFSQAKIRIVGVGQVPLQNEIVLVNRQNSVPVNIRLNPGYEYETVNSRMPFKLIVGEKNFVANEIQKDIPTEFRLEQNYPNPFNPSTSIAYSVPREADIKLEIVSLLGERVAVLGEGHYQAGTYTVVWNPTDGSNTRNARTNGVGGQASGVYFCRFVVDGTTHGLIKMLFLK